VRRRRVSRGYRGHCADPDRARAPVDAHAAAPQRCRSRSRRVLMEAVLAIAIGVLTASGVWLILRPRTFQVIIGLSLVSYAVNLFIDGRGRLRVDAPARAGAEPAAGTASLSDPVPQALVLAAIVIPFAMTALMLVVLLAARGLTGTDH